MKNNKKTMIEKKINNLKNTLSNVRMSETDKRDVFKRISLVVDKIEAVSSESHDAPILSPFPHDVVFANGIFNNKFATNIFVYIKQRKFVPSLVVVLLLTVTGAISASAENALPGDSLYSLKLNVNEQVKGIVAVTPEAKARLAVESTERRLQEAVILSSQGKLTDDKKQIIQDQLNKNATEIKNSVASLVASNNISIAQEVSINFEASLKTHELILESINNAGSVQTAVASTTASSSASTTDVAMATAQPVNTLLQDIKQQIIINTKVREDLSQKELEQKNDFDSVTTKIKNANSKYEDLAYQRSSLTDLSPASIKILDSYLTIASSTINSAQNSLNNGDLSQVVTFIQQAVKSMSDSDSLISIELNMKPETRRVLELIDINKLINNTDNATDITASSTATSTGAVLGTSTESTTHSSSTTSTGKTEVK